VNPNAPAFLMGPANPIGGALGWLGLALLLLARRSWWAASNPTTASMADS
jgi:hypothetical protein